MRKSVTVLATIAALALIVAPTYAQKDNPGHGRGGPPDKSSAGGPGKGHGQGQGQGQGQGVGQGQGGPPGLAGPSGQGGSVVIADRDRNAIYSYYRTEYAAGRCPPGLAKKGNGCLPPGQVKKMWAIGQPLPAGIAYYPLPPVLLGQLSPVPAGYQYVRVANDILLMAVGTGMIAAAVADLSSF
jgi:hypothetical protein